MMSGIIDFHSHILPGVDDGSATLEESIALLRMEAEQGIRHVVATPHFYARHDRPDRFLKRRRNAELLLREQMQKYPDLPQVSVGAEVYYFHGIGSSDAVLELTIDEKRCILIEMPHVTWTESMYSELESIYTRYGLTPIIAHIDRYIKPFQARQVLKRLSELPVLVQANAEFFLNRATGNMALRMLKKDQIQLLGSDCHNLTDRKPNLGAAVELIQKRIGNEVVERINQYQEDVLSI